MSKLNKLSTFPGRPGPLLLIVMDGIGIGKEDDGNAVYLAKPANLIKYENECRERNLFCQLKAHGTAVGMPSDKDMGNSEVGHNALGSGQIIDQGAKLVDRAIKEKIIFQTDLWKKSIDAVKKNDKTVHLIGLLSDGNVHSHIDQLFHILDGIAESGAKKVRLHILSDGRDVPSRSILTYVQPLEKKLKEIMESNNAFDYRIASGGGRMLVTMDRYESDWNIVKRGWYAHVMGIIDPETMKSGYTGYYSSAEEAILKARDRFPDTGDQYLPPYVITDSKGKPVGKISDGDFVINFNFRGDRTIQISRAFEEDDFNDFKRIDYPKVNYAGLTEYDSDLQIPKKYLVSPPEINNTLTEYCCANDISEFSIAETHKFGHVTFFWNGNRSGYFCKDIEKYVEIKSEPNEMTLKNPLMKAEDVCDKTLEALTSGKYKFVRVNFANGDMVGHTGNIDAAVKAVKIVDDSIGRLIEANKKLNGITIITADHGNCEEMKYPDGKPVTAHSLNPVGFWIIDDNWNEEYKINDDISDAGLTNVAATVLNLLGFDKPKDYRESLINFK